MQPKKCKQLTVNSWHLKNAVLNLDLHLKSRFAGLVLQICDGQEDSTLCRTHKHTNLTVAQNHSQATLSLADTHASEQLLYCRVC